jgi:endonuclease YncB( thermonuclease family)
MATLLSQAIDLAQQARTDTWQLRIAIQDIESAFNYHINAIPFFNAALQQIEVADLSLGMLRNFRTTNDEELTVDEQDYIDTIIKTLASTLEGYRLRVNRPTLTPEIVEAQELTGKVTEVEDVDTIVIDNTHKIRFAGIDGAEIGTDNGKLAQKELAALVFGKNVTVKIDKHNPIEIYARGLGTVMFDNKNINVEMVRRCLSKINTKFGKNVFVDRDEMEIAAQNCSSWPGWGIFHIYSRPTNAAVMIDGKDTGIVAPDKFPLSQGEHEVAVIFTDKNPAVQTIFIGPGETQLRVDLNDIGSDVGTVKIEATNPIHPLVTVDDVYNGQAPVILSLSTTEPHNIIASADGYKTKEIEFNTNVNSVTVIKLDLEKN